MAQDLRAQSGLVPFEVLDLPFMLFCRLKRFERTQISSLTGLGILLARIYPILS
jgi:hypothetical protein